jgi:hypothetical protein
MLMAEEQYVTYDKYRADLADFRSDMARFREEIRVEIANTRGDLRTEMSRLHSQTIVWVGGMLAASVTLTVTLIKLIP